MSGLPELETTVGELVLDLLRAPRLHPELVRSAPVDQRGEVPPDAVRITQHYVAGLLAYGFDSSHEELRLATEWFATEFPGENRQRVDAVEMTRLEALLLLNAPEEYIIPRLEQLVQQRTVGGDHFVIEGRGSDFDTLWALKVLQFAEQRGMLNGLVDHNQLRQLAGRIIAGVPLDKDLALALRLRYELAGNLRQTQQQSLEKLLRVAERSGGVWGLDQGMLWLAEYMRQQNLTAGDVAAHRDVLREMILSTCYVIENLMPLADAYPVVREQVTQAMELWWGVIQGRNAASVIYTLFPKPYDYLMILARTLVTLRAYLNMPLIQWGAPYVHRRLAEQELEQATHPDRESIRMALRNWLHVDLEGEPERLRLGMSDSDIMRVRPLVWNPTILDDAGRLHIPYADSLIVKFGPVQEVALEQQNYSRLPNSIRPCFASVPAPTYTDDRGRAFLILQDLNRFRTLDETLRRVPQVREAVSAELGPFLLWMHQGQVRKPATAPYGLLWELYLLPMQAHIGRIFAYIEDNSLLDQPRMEQAYALKQALLGLMGDLVSYQLRMEGFPVAYMHGDLHSRNIMVRKLRPRERNDDDRELEFKLIDLEKFRLDGDAALDAGELLADLEITMRSLKGASDRRHLEALVAVVEEAYRTFATNRQDEMFGIRLELAKARSLIRVAKGRTKAGYAALRESRRAPAISVAYELLDLAEDAVNHLNSVLNAMR
ncbi:MAG: hypothetical protein Kow0077_24540 [Anaerolineae bacterium]